MPYGGPLNSGRGRHQIRHLHHLGPATNILCYRFATTRSEEQCRSLLAGVGKRLGLRVRHTGRGRLQQWEPPTHPPVAVFQLSALRGCEDEPLVFARAGTTLPLLRLPWRALRRSRSARGRGIARFAFTVFSSLHAPCVGVGGQSAVSAGSSALRAASALPPPPLRRLSSRTSSTACAVPEGRFKLVIVCRRPSSERS